MSDDKADSPFDPAEYTAAELHLARQVILASRRATPPPAREPEVVREGFTYFWRKTDTGGEARRVHCLTWQGDNYSCCETLPDASNDPGWFPCTQEEFKVLSARPPEPDQVVDDRPSPS
jgi:hypothetical protein